MKKIFESELNGWDESAERIHVYAREYEKDDEFYMYLEHMDHDEKCDAFGFYEEHNVAPGTMYHRYEFDITSTHVVIYETVAINV